MVHLTGKLTVKQVESIGSPGKYNDGAGLYLFVKESGAKSWVLRTVIKGTRRDIGLGGVSYTSLQDARRKALEYRSVARNGGDPRISKNQNIPTFAELAEKVHQERLPIWKNPKHAAQWINTLKDYAFPEIGNTGVDGIDSSDVLKIVSPLWTDKHETARRVLQRIGVILDVAKARKFRAGENPVQEIKALGVLPKVKKKPKHHGSMKWQELPEFYARLCERSEVAAFALRFTILTGARTSETLGATWDEIESNIWTLSAQRMKADREHAVPLSSEALSILDRMRGVSDQVVFEGQKRHLPLSNMAMENVLRRMDMKKYNITVHGFRSTFRVWVAENKKASFEAAEAALAHNINNKTQIAYNRTNYLEERKPLMERWAQFVTGQEAKVVQFG